MSDIENNSKKMKQIEYLGNLRCFKRFGNCGSHPLYQHINYALKDFEFSSDSRQPINIRNLLLGLYNFPRLCRCGLKFLVGRDARKDLKTFFSFLLTRDLYSQLAIVRQKELYFLPSVPMTFGQVPWVMEIEDVTTLFFPFIHNGHTASLQIKEHPAFNCVQSLLDAKECKGIITHVASTAQCLKKIFAGTSIPDKIFYFSMGIPVIPHKSQMTNTGTCEFLFTNSWHQKADSFYCRGGLDTLVAFEQIYEQYQEKVHLTIRSAIPQTLPKRFCDIIKKCNVAVIDHYLPKEEFHELWRRSNVYLLPVARIHIISLLEAMSYGKCIITSDGWGIEEYVKNDFNACIIKGRYGKTSWTDPNTEFLMEDYSCMYTGDSNFSQKLMEMMKKAVSNPEWRQRLEENARQSVVDNYNINRWNENLNNTFSKIMSR